MNHILLQDFSHPWQVDPNIIDFFRNKKILITGASGFFGKWLLGSLITGNALYDLNCEIVAMSRNPQLFCINHPEFNNNSIEWIQGDILDGINYNKDVDFVIHGATAASEKLNQENPSLMLFTIIEGTKNILQFCEKHLRHSFLNISSGAVYGTQPTSIYNIEESSMNGPDICSPYSAYAEGKRISEFLTVLFAEKNSHLKVNSARCYAFCGPYLPLGTHFAMGNFILNVMNKEPIIIKGDGTPHRSYMYMSDLCLWLLKILAAGKNKESYNVGSEQGVPISELANLLKDVSTFELSFTPDIQILQRPISAEFARYVPSTRKARMHLGVTLSVDLQSAVTKHIRFLKNNSRAFE